MVESGSIRLQDGGSANGTFVNGNVAIQQEILNGDRIGVGPYIFEVAIRKKKKISRSPALPELDKSNVVQFPSNPIDMGNDPIMPMQSPEISGALSLPNQSDQPMEFGAEEPQDLPSRIKHFFEHYVMPFFYSWNLKSDWKQVCIFSFGLFIIASLFASIQPLLDYSENMVIQETKRRARSIARNIVEMNAPFLARDTETKTTVGGALKEYGVREAYLVDLDNRIIAPQSKLNETLLTGPEARTAVTGAKKFRQGLERGFVVTNMQEKIVVAVEPVKILNVRLARNVVSAMSVVSIDVSLATPSWGTISLIYSKSLVILFILGFVLFAVLGRLTLKPMEILNDDIDKVLRGEINQVTHEFKNTELNQLYDVVNSALQRIPKDNADGESGGLGGSASADDIMNIAQLFSDIQQVGVLVFDEDKQIRFINPTFEEVTGIRFSEAQSSTIGEVARDQAFVALIEDMFEQISNSSGAAVQEEFDFSGVEYNITGAGLGQGTPKGFLFTATQKVEAY